MNTEVGKRVKRYREQRNFTQEFMAGKLGISQNSYSKIESGGVKINIDRLNAIAEILEVSVEDLLNEGKQVFNFNESSIDKFYGYIEHLHEDNKELTKSTIKILEDQLKYLQGENERLLKVIEAFVPKK